MAVEMQFHRSRVHDLWDEIQPLLRLHYQEISAYPDIPLEPSKEIYLAMEEAGHLRCYTARADGTLLGYAVYVARAHAHYMSSLQAVQDVLYLHPSVRGLGAGRRLIAYADEQLRQEGVQVVYHHVKLKHDFGPILKRMGYELLEHVWAKRLR